MWVLLFEKLKLVQFFVSRQLPFQNLLSCSESRPASQLVPIISFCFWDNLIFEIVNNKAFRFLFDRLFVLLRSISKINTYNFILIV